MLERFATFFFFGKERRFLVERRPSFSLPALAMDAPREAEWSGAKPAKNRSEIRAETCVESRVETRIFSRKKCPEAVRPSFGPVRGGPVFEAVCFDAHVVGPVGRTLAEGVTGGEEPPELVEPPEPLAPSGALFVQLALLRAVARAVRTSTSSWASEKSFTDTSCCSLRRWVTVCMREGCVSGDTWRKPSCR